MKIEEWRIVVGGKGRGWLWVEGWDAFLAWEPVSLKVAVRGPDQPTGNVVEGVLAY